MAEEKGYWSLAFSAPGRGGAGRGGGARAAGRRHLGVPNGPAGFRHGRCRMAPRSTHAARAGPPADRRPARKGDRGPIPFRPIDAGAPGAEGRLGRARRLQDAPAPPRPLFRPRLSYIGGSARLARSEDRCGSRLRHRAPRHHPRPARGARPLGLTGHRLAHPRYRLRVGGARRRNGEDLAPSRLGRRHRPRRRRRDSSECARTAWLISSTRDAATPCALPGFRAPAPTRSSPRIFWRGRFERCRLHLRVTSRRVAAPSFPAFCPTRRSACAPATGHSACG